ncbi:MAG: B12-binding domain-containing radical SAM protein [Actinomycetales bacterium]|nr:B12-binding domain-containing radical SAM protein [Actinomycetales bacterium]
MRVTMILPALTEATSPFLRPVKYALFPPLGLATLAGYLRADDEVRLLDEHVQRLDVDRDRPDLVVIQTYVTSARRAYQLADAYRERGTHVAMGGLHVTSLPDKAAAHADTVFVGPGEDTWPVFLADFRRGRPQPRYVSTTRSLHGMPPVRRDLIQRQRYLVPNSIVVSRGCPHHCDFCYKDAFFAGGRSFYTQRVDAALAEIVRLPGRHLYFLDDHLFGDRRFARELMAGLRGMGRLWQAAATVDTVLTPGLVEQAARVGLRSLFVGFETVNATNLPGQRKRQNIGTSYEEVVSRAHDAGVMINASFVFGMDDDGPDVFDRTVEWALAQGVETATFHILTPYPGTGLHRRMTAQGRILHSDWDRYDTRHAVFTPRGMTRDQLEDGYHRAYRDFYRWSAIWRAAATKPVLAERLRHLAFTGAWKKLDPAWDLLIRTRRVLAALPLLEATLDGFGGRRQAPEPPDAPAHRSPVAPGAATECADPCEPTCSPAGPRPGT